MDLANNPLTLASNPLTLASKFSALKPSHDSCRQCLLHDWQLLPYWSRNYDWHVSMLPSSLNCLL